MSPVTLAFTKCASIYSSTFPLFDSFYPFSTDNVGSDSFLTDMRRMGALIDQLLRVSFILLLFLHSCRSSASNDRDTTLSVLT